jgi:hypothetical protein
MAIDIEKNTVEKIDRCLDESYNKQHFEICLKLIENYRNKSRDIKGYQQLKQKYINKTMKYEKI